MSNSMDNFANNFPWILRGKIDPNHHFLVRTRKDYGLSPFSGKLFIGKTTNGHKKLLVEYKGEKPERNLSGFDHSLLSEIILTRYLSSYQVRIITFRFCSFLNVLCLLGRIRLVQ
jgi:hypothetical protein